MKTKNLNRKLKPPIGGSLKLVGLECSLAMCPPGLFVFEGSLGFKTEYNDENGPEAYVVASGQYFWGGTTFAGVRSQLRVTPVAFIPNTQAEP